MAAITPAEQAVLDLQAVQTKLMVLAQAGQPLSADKAIELSDSIGASVERIRRTFARTAKALRGED